MAKRPVFIPQGEAPFARAIETEFSWNGGFAPSQKQKNIRALHGAFLAARPDARVLEISSKSMQENGPALSAFALVKYVPALGRSVPVENVFQAGKVFEHGGPYQDLLTVPPRDAKRDERLRTGGRLTGFYFDGRICPIRPETAFYDYLYISALLENPALAETVLSYDAFTDIEFNPQKSLNCQAAAAARFVSLHRLGLLTESLTFEAFLGLYAPEEARHPQEKET